MRIKQSIWFGLLFVCMVAVSQAVFTAPFRIGSIDDWSPPSMTTVELDIGEPLFLRAGDFNEDGQPDLLVAAEKSSEGHYQYRVFLLPGIGEGKFGEPLQVGQGPVLDDDGRYGSGTAVVTDLDRDEHLDLIAFFESAKGSSTAFLEPSTIANQFLILWGNGDGTFQSQWLEVHQRLAPPNIVVGDFDGDGNLDIAYADWQRLAINIVYNKGGRILGEVHPVEINEENAPHIAIPAVLAAADLNHDGKSDLVVGGACIFDDSGAEKQYKGFIEAVLSCGTGCFHPWSRYVMGVSDRRPSAPSFLLQDLNNDGNIDVVFVEPASSREIIVDPLAPPPIGHIRMMSGNGDGGFSKPIDLGLCFAPDGLLSIRGTTSIGLTFILVSPYYGFRILHGVPPTIDESASLSIEDLTDEVVVDIDNDGWVEIVAATDDWENKATRIVIVGRHTK